MARFAIRAETVEILEFEALQIQLVGYPSMASKRIEHRRAVPVTVDLSVNLGVDQKDLRFKWVRVTTMRMCNANVIIEYS